MGLITEEVEVGLSRNIKHYEDLGYKIPRRKDKKGRINVVEGTKILVKVQDLPNSSAKNVNIKCDGCGKELINIKWIDYLRSVKEDGKYYCQKCANKLFASKTRALNKLKNGRSFEQWCIKNNRQEILDRWDYELNDCLPDEINYGTKKKYYFKCPEELHKSELKNINSFTSGKEGSIQCKMCNSFAQWGIDNLGEDFLEKYWDYENNTVDPWNITKCANKPKVWIKCQEKDYHGSYDIRCNDFINSYRCPYCTNQHGKVHPLDSLGKLLEDKGLLHLYSENNKQSSYKYAPFSQQKVYWKCPEGLHENYPRRIGSSNYYDFRCPECNNYSKGEERISNYFIDIGFIKIADEDYKILNEVFKQKYVYYIPQKKFDSLIGLGNGQLSYDFYLPNLQYNLLIEYDGEYHYKPIKNYKNEPIKHAEAKLKKQQKHDKLKNEYAKNNNINLLRIPYWDYDNIEEILDNYFKNINIVNY
jgi:hypothetical protein